MKKIYFTIFVLLLTSCSISNQTSTENKIIDKNIYPENITTENINWNIKKIEDLAIEKEIIPKVIDEKLTQEDIDLAIIQSYYQAISDNDFEKAYNLRHDPQADYKTFKKWFLWIKTASIEKYHFSWSWGKQFNWEIKLTFPEEITYNDVIWSIKETKFSLTSSKKTWTEKIEMQLWNNKCNVSPKTIQWRQNYYKNKQLDYSEFISKMKIKYLCFNWNTWNPFLWVNWDKNVSDSWEKFVIWLENFNSGGWWDAYLEYSTYDFSIWSHYQIHASKDDYLNLKNKKNKITVNGINWYIEYENEYFLWLQKKYIFPFNQYYIAFIYHYSHSWNNFYNSNQKIEELDNFAKRLNNSEPEDILNIKENNNYKKTLDDIKIIQDFVNNIEFIDKQNSKKN